LIPFLAGAVAVPLVLNAAVSTQHLPEYASWTGIRPLEEKLHKLDRFASKGPVDTLVIGSSISDFGINAEDLSRRMTAATGKPYRVFNFSTGGTELVTTPTLYRMARTVTKPRTLLLAVPEEIKRSDTIDPATPDYTLRRAPIGTAIAHPWLFPIEKRVFDIPLVRYGAPLRDGIVFGGYAHLPAQGSDDYWIDESGDTVSLSFQTKKADLAYLRDLRAKAADPLTDRQMATWSQRRKLEHYFNTVDIDAMEQLRKLTAADGVQVVIVATDVAADYYPTPLADPAYVRAQRQFFEILGTQLHAKVIDELGKFRAQQYMITDTVHLNRHGAEDFTRLLAGALTNSPVSQSRRVAEVPPLPDVPPKDPTISGFAAIVDAPKRPGAQTLRLEILRNRAITPLPDVPLTVMLRLPDHTDVSAPARLTSRTTVEATFRALPVGPNKLFLARIVYEAGGSPAAANQPVAAYSWSK
jgi:hypothetical protein